MTPRTHVAALGLTAALAASSFVAPCDGWAAELASGASGVGASAERPSPYRGRLEGDAAMAGRDYAVAASFYLDYRNAAQRAKDLPALKDAFERQVDALILARLPELASESISQFAAAFPNLDADSLGMWKADICNLQGRNQEAAQLLQPIIERLPARDPRRTRAMSSLAVALEGVGDLAQAADVYASIQDEAGEASPLRRGAFIRETICLASAGQLQRAKELLQSAPFPKTAKASDDFNLLALFIALKESGPAKSENAYSQARMELKDGPNLLAYDLATAFGDSWLNLKMARKALDCYRDAFGFAPSRLEACESARLLMGCMNALDLKSEAADFAMRHLELFKGSSAQSDMKLQAARLLVSAGRLSDAVTLYLQIAQEAAPGSALRLAAAKECARAKTDMNDLEGAASVIRQSFGSLPDKGECDFLLAEILQRGRRYAEAGDAFSQVAAKFPSWRERALYEAMRSYIDAQNSAKALAVSDSILSEFDAGDVRKDTLYQRARIFEMSGQTERACAEYLSFANAYPNIGDLAPQALYRAGRLYFMAGKLQDAEKRFSELTQRYPQHALAPNAAYWRIHAFYGMGDELSADRATWPLVESHPDSEFAYAALFSLAFSYSESGLPDRAEKILDNILEMPKASSDIKAKAFFEKAYVAFKAGSYDKAGQLLDSLDEQYKSSAYVSDGYFLRADMLKERGDYSKAADYYKKARERVPNSLLEIAANGGLADCLFSIGAPARDSAQLSLALDLYRQIVARADAPASFKNMSLYKAGRCQELLGDSAGALDSYKSLLYRYQVSTRMGEQPDALWTLKAADALFSICLKRGSPDDFQSADDMLSWLRKAELLPEREVKIRSDELEKARRRQ